jgi:hypothetical protein
VSNGFRQDSRCRREEEVVEVEREKRGGNLLSPPEEETVDVLCLCWCSTVCCIFNKHHCLSVGLVRERERQSECV